MEYVFMDNFRGFARTVIPLHSATFLVGENSTGKSSFLSLLYLLSNTQFWLNLDFSQDGFVELGGFRDIVSASGDNRTRFTVGFLATRPRPRGKEGEIEGRFGLLTFRNEDGRPRLCEYTQYVNSTLLRVKFHAKITTYKSAPFPAPNTTEVDLVRLLLQTYADGDLDKGDFKRVPKYVPSYSALPYVLGAIHPLAGPKGAGHLVFRNDIPIIQNMTWVAPIRTRPRRTYDGFKTNFTPEGDHTPHVIRKILGSRDKAHRFVDSLRRFGEASGLFKRVEAHSFGRGPDAPFEVRIEIAGSVLNVSNVGYGVSQVLPVVVEMITRPAGHWFAIQQPEVHLHPRAQAALGELIHDLVTERQHRYIIETHSDYLIDRYRLSTRKTAQPQTSQVVFFERGERGNTASPIPIDSSGKYSDSQPESFRRFFINEEIDLLGL